MSYKQNGGFDCTLQEEFSEYLKSIGIEESLFKIYSDNCVQKNWNIDDSRISLINQTNTSIIQQIDDYITKNNKSPSDKKEILENLESYIKTCGGLQHYGVDEQQQESYKTCVKLFLSNSEPDISRTVSVSNKKLKPFIIDPDQKDIFIKYSSDNNLVIRIRVKEDIYKQDKDSCINNKINLNDEKYIKLDGITFFYDYTKDNVDKDCKELLKVFLIELITYFDSQGKPFIYFNTDRKKGNIIIGCAFRGSFDLNKDYTPEDFKKNLDRIFLLELQKQKSNVLKEFNIKQGDGPSLSDDTVKKIIDYLDNKVIERNAEIKKKILTVLKELFDNNIIQINNRSILFESCKSDNERINYCILDDKIKINTNKTGGYYEKYIKYKNKYLELKRNL
jgi:hypothetical protein